MTKISNELGTDCESERKEENIPASYHTGVLQLGQLLPGMTQTVTPRERQAGHRLPVTLTRV